MKGRFVNLDVKIRNGRIQDVLRLAVKSAKPVMLGAARAAGEAAAAARAGEGRSIASISTAASSLENAHFTDPGVQDQLAMLSRRAQGKKPDAIRSASIHSDMRGTVHAARRHAQA